MEFRDRWLTLIRDAISPQSLDWIERQLLRRRELDDIYRAAIDARRAQIHGL